MLCYSLAIGIPTNENKKCKQVWLCAAERMDVNTARSEAGFSVGDRVMTVPDPEGEFYKATVRYVGRVGDTKGVWIGVDWDKPTRGKHDGCHENKRYFLARHESSGSFVRPNKVVKGISVAQGVQNRYGLVLGDTAGVEENVMEQLRKETNAPFIEVVGFDKVNRVTSNFKNLRVIGLKNEGVAGLCGDHGVKEQMPNVLEMDLSDNLISDWEDVVEIGTHFDKLSLLNLNGNFMRKLNDPAVLNSTFPRLTQLLIGEMNLAWSDIEPLVAHLPQLEVLHVHCNKIDRVDKLADGIFPNLKQLNLSENPLTHWDDVLQFASLPKLFLLNLRRCQLREIHFPQSPKTFFPALKSLQLSNNQIEDWRSVAALHRLSVESMSMRTNPVLETESGETARQLFIASIASLKIFNGTEIFKTERYGAELDYLKKYGRQYLDAAKSTDKHVKLEEFFKRHPRYPDFLKRFGPPMEEELIEEKKSLKSRLIEVNLHWSGFDNDIQSRTQKISPTLTVLKLKYMLQRITKVRSHLLSLSYISTDHPDVEVQLDNDMRDLIFYSIKEGDTIYIHATE